MDGNTTVIITTEQIVPIPSNRPTVDMELWLEIKCITNPQTVNINPDENTVGIAAFTDSTSACFLSYNPR